MTTLCIYDLPRTEVIDFTARLRRDRVVEALTHRAQWLHISGPAYRAGIATAVTMLEEGHSASRAWLRGYAEMTREPVTGDAA